MYVLVTYDVETMTSDGQRRLRQVARQCLNYGQRVQNSVFECSVSPAQFTELRLKLSDIIDHKKVQSAKPPVHLFKTKRFYFEVLFQNEASLLEQNQTAFKWTSNPI